MVLYACIAVAVFLIGLYYSYSVEETKKKEEEEQVSKENLEESESSNEE